MKSNVLDFSAYVALRRQLELFKTDAHGAAEAPPSVPILPSYGKQLAVRNVAHRQRMLTYLLSQTRARAN